MVNIAKFAREQILAKHPGAAVEDRRNVAGMPDPEPEPEPEPLPLPVAGDLKSLAAKLGRALIE